MTDYTRVLKGLRHCINLDGLEPNDTRIRCHGCPYFTEPTRCGGILMRDAADAIEALQAEVPKRGEWIVTTETSDDGAVSQHINCSVCGFYWREPKHRKVFKRCPNCGAKMEVQE